MGSDTSVHRHGRSQEAPPGGGVGRATRSAVRAEPGRGQDRRPGCTHGGRLPGRVVRSVTSAVPGAGSDRPGCNGTPPPPRGAGSDSHLPPGLRAPPRGRLLPAQNWGEGLAPRPPLPSAQPGPASPSRPAARAVHGPPWLPAGRQEAAGQRRPAGAPGSEGTGCGRRHTHRLSHQVADRASGGSLRGEGSAGIRAAPRPIPGAPTLTFSPFTPGGPTTACGEGQ